MVELIVSSQQRAFGRDKLEGLSPDCLACDVRFACNGGCPKDRFVPGPDGDAEQSYLCAGYKAFFHHVVRPMSAMCQLLREDRAPADLMSLYAAEDAQRGRNEACTCGSGRKWKNCHGANRLG